MSAAAFWLWQACSNAATGLDIPLGHALCVLDCEQRSRSTTQLLSLHVIRMRTIGMRLDGF